MTAPRVLAIVVTFNSTSQILACIDALSASSLAVDVLVVDNGSADGTAAFVRRERPSVVVIEQDNRGYAGGNNRGLIHAKSAGKQYALVVNPDIVLDRDCVERLVAFADEHPLVALASPKIYYPDRKTIWFAGARINWIDGTTPQVGQGQIDIGIPGPPEPIERACGAAMLVCMDAVSQVGPMAEEYFLYFEEVDWSVRFVAAGWELFIVPAARCVHAPSSSTGVDSPLLWYYLTRNNLLFMSRFGRANGKTFRRALGRRSWQQIRRCLEHPSQRNFHRAGAVAKGWLDFALRRFGKGW